MKVRFEDQPTAITVKLGSIQPTQVGQIVRVSGAVGDMWVTDVVGGAALVGPVSADIGMPSPLALIGVGPGFVAQWSSVPYIAQYELQVADDAGFTVNNRSFLTVATQFSVDALTEGNTYYARVRAVGSGGTTGAFTATESIVVPGFPDPTDPDGVPPPSSPQPVVTSTIGAVLVEWVPVPNNDVVTYDVHAALESGFTADTSNKIGETTGTFYQVRRLADSTPLSYTSPTFVRLIARDTDGAAPAGAQGFATPDQVNTDDFGFVDETAISDGSPPANSPASFNVVAGIGYLFITWEPVTNADRTEYEVHMGTTPTFTPTANTLAHTTLGAFCFLRRRPAGFGGGPLTYDQTYYIKIWAKDNDGYATNPSPAQPGTPIKTGSSDIGDGAVGTLQIGDAAIVSAKIADLAVGQAKIQDAAITTAKIENAAITGAKIGIAAIGQANIADAAIGTAQIANAAITDAKIASLSADKINVGTLTGIDISAVTMTGSTITGGTVTGTTLKTATTGQRVEIEAGANSGFVYYYSGDVNELFPGFVRSGFGFDPYLNAASFITVAGPKVSTAAAGRDSGPVFEMWQRLSDGVHVNRVSGVFQVRDGWIESNSIELSLRINKASGTIERGNIGEFQTRFYYSTGDAEFRLQSDGNAAIYHSALAVWNAGVTISDRRVKKNIRPAPTSDAMAKLRQIPFVTYEFDRPGLPEGTRHGVIAQDVQAAHPQGVNEVGDSLLLDPQSILGLALGAIQNLDERVRALE